GGGAGWVNVGGGGVGPEPGPDGGARLTAAPGSGTEAGGTGGGRSLNNCARAGAAITTAEAATSAITANQPGERQDSMSRLNVMISAFHRKRGEFKPPGS